MDKLLITRYEAAEALSVSVDTLDEIRKSGKLKAVQIGARIYYSPDELRAYITKEGQIHA